MTSLPSFLFRLLAQALKVAHTGDTIKKLELAPACGGRFG